LYFKYFFVLHILGQLLAGDSDTIGEHIEKAIRKQAGTGTSVNYEEPTNEEEARVKRELTESEQQPLLCFNQFALS
jgi:hypothetical protein